MLTRQMADRRRPAAFADREPAPPELRSKRKRDKSSPMATEAQELPDYLAGRGQAGMLFSPLPLYASPTPFPTANPLLGTPLESLGPRTDQLIQGGSRPPWLEPAYCSIPNDITPLYGSIDRQLAEGPERIRSRREDGRPDEDKKSRKDEGQPDGKDKDKDKDKEKKEGKEEGKAGDGAGGAAGGQEGADQAQPADAAEGKDAKKARKPSRSKSEDDAPTGPKLVEIPQAETEFVTLSREPALHTEPAPSFTTPEAPVFTVPRGAKPEPPSRDQERAILLFAEAMRVVRQLHEELVADAALAARRVQATANRLSDLRQRDLDQAVETLAKGLLESRSRLDERADAALERVEEKARSTNAMIWGLAGYALAQLANAKSEADRTFKTHEDNKTKASDKAQTSRNSVAFAGLFASFAILFLDLTKQEDNPLNIEPLPSAQNEKINMHLGMTAGRRAKTYTEESTAETDSLDGTFTAMNDALKTQFAEVTKAMTKTSADSDAAIVKARNAALKQLRSSVEQLRNFVAETRASGHAALVQQHNLSRRQIIVGYRERGRSESQAAQQRMLRGTSSSLALATAQQTAARSLAESLGKEKGRPPAEFAKVIVSSATVFTRQVGRTRADQRVRIARSAEAAEAPVMRQADATSARSAASADEIVQRIQGAGDNASTSTDTQVEKQLEPFPKIPKVIVDTLKGVLKSATTAYESHNEYAGKCVDLANTTITNAMSGKGGGSADNKNEAAKPPEAKKDAKPAYEIPNEFIARATGIQKEPKSDVGVSNYLTSTRKTILDAITGKAQRLNSALRAFSTPIEPVMAELRGLTALQGVALTDHYDHTYKGRSLVRDLRKELRKTFSATSTNNYNISAALAYLRGDHKAGALQEMKAAVNYSNDEGRVERVQRSLTPKELEELNEDHKDEMEDIVSDLGGNEEVAARALNEIKGEQKGETEEQRTAREEANIQHLAKANAYGLQTEIDRSRKKKDEAGGDKTSEMLATKYQSIGSDTLSGGDPMGAAFVDPDVASKRRDAIWKATGVAFTDAVKTLPDGTPNKPKEGETPGLSAIARYAAAKREYVDYVPNKSGRGFHWERTTSGLEDHQTELIDAIAKHGGDSEEAAAATVMVELNRKGGKVKEDKLRSALDTGLGAREGETDAARARRENDEYRDGKLIRKGERTLAQERRDRILQKVGVLDARAKAKANPGAEAAKSEPAPPRDPAEVKKEIVQKLDVKLAFDPTARAYTKSMVENLDPDPKAAFSFALAHKDKNKETLIAATSRMNRDEIDKAVAEWDAAAAKDGKEPLYKQLGLYETGKGKLEGDVRNEVERKFMGVPRTDRERAEVAHMSSKQVVRDSRHTAGRTLAGEEYRRLVENQGKLLEMMGVREEDIDARGRIKIDVKTGQPLQGNFDKDGNLRIKSLDQRNDFEMAMALSSLHAESYNQAVDRIAMGITMALMIIAAAVTTFFTAGTAAAIWGPILVTLAAGAAGIAFNQALKGDRYTSAELQRDIVMTLVQAATAGLGAYAGALLKGGGAAAKVGTAVGKAGEAAASSAPKLTMGMKALNLGKEVLIDSAIGGTTNSINSAAGAYMDPENRRLGKSGEKAVEGGIKGFFGGAVGSALTKPMGNLGKMRGGALGERLAGNVASGFTTRLTEARVGQALGDPHQSWAESLEVAKEGIGQDIVQSVAEHRAHRAGERWGMRREAAKVRRWLEAGVPWNEIQPKLRFPIHQLGLEAPGGPQLPLHPVSPDSTSPRPPPKPSGPQHTPESVARAANVREALPPDARSIVDQAVPVKPPVAPEAPSTPIRPPETPPSGGDMPASAGRKAEEGAADRKAGGPDGTRAGRKPAKEKPVKYRSADEPFDPDKTNPEIHIPAPKFPNGIDLKPGSLEKLPHIMPDTDVPPTNPKDAVQARLNYDLMRTYRPDVEVMLARNPVTGDWTARQGMRGEVTPLPPPWITERHSHGKLVTTDPYRKLTKVLPSAIEGDVQALRNELDRIPSPGPHVEVRRASVIDIEIGNTHVQTTFEITRKGDNYSLTVTIRPPIHGESSLGPFTGDKDSFIKTYAEKARDLTSGGSQFGLDRKPSGDVKLRADSEDPSRVTRNATPAESARHDAQLAAQGKLQPGGEALSRAVKPDDPDIVLYHGTKAEHAESIRTAGIDPHRRSGKEDDFGRGFYTTIDEVNAQAYASRRSGVEGGGAVVKATIKLSELGVVVDVRTGGEHRAAWDAFLDRSPPLYPPGIGSFFKNTREYLQGKIGPNGRHLTMPVQDRGGAFEAFLAEHRLGHADAIRGDLGKDQLTGGIAAKGGGEQIAIRSKRLAELMNERAGFGPKPPEAPAAAPTKYRSEMPEVGEPPGPPKQPPAATAAGGEEGYKLSPEARKGLADFRKALPTEGKELDDFRRNHPKEAAELESFREFHAREVAELDRLLGLESEIVGRAISGELTKEQVARLPELTGEQLKARAEKREGPDVRDLHFKALRTARLAAGDSPELADQHVAALRALLLTPDERIADYRQKLLSGAIVPDELAAWDASTAHNKMSRSAKIEQLVEAFAKTQPRAGGGIREFIAVARQQEAMKGAASSLNLESRAALDSRVDEAALKKYRELPPTKSAQPQRDAFLRLDTADRELLNFLVRRASTDPTENAALVKAWIKARARDGIAPGQRQAEAADLQLVLQNGEVLTKLNKARKTQADRNARTEKSIEEMALENPLLLSLSYSDRKLFLERYASIMEKRKKSEGPMTTDEYVGKVLEHMDSHGKPGIGEPSSVFGVGKDIEGSPGITMLKTGSLGEGRTNKPGIDVIAVDPTTPKGAKQGDVGVMLFDDKRISAKKLYDVEALTKNLADHLSEASKGHQADFEARQKVIDELTVRLGPDDPHVMELRNALAAHRSAVRQMEAAGKEIAAIDPNLGRNSTHPDSGVERYQSYEYAIEVARILKAHGIQLYVTTKGGQTTSMAKWLEHFGFKLWGRKSSLPIPPPEGES